VKRGGWGGVEPGICHDTGLNEAVSRE
jgi:hypothetical protein